MNLRRWLTVGIGVKRWLLVAFGGLLLLALGVAHAIRQATADLEPVGPMQAVLEILTLRPLPYELRGLIAGLVGGGLFLFGAYRVLRALMEPFAPWDRELPLVEAIYQKRYLARGPRVVAIGGGTGLSILLRGLKGVTANLTAVVTVADDGGSSGVLRSQLGIPAVGDIRNCIVALADAEPLMGRLLQYRFPGRPGVPASGPDPVAHPGPTVDPVAGPGPAADGATALPVTDAVIGGGPAARPGLAGHPVGNLLLAALVDLEGDDFEEAVRQMNRVLAVRGRVVPATSTPLTLHARLGDGTQVDGQSRVSRSGAIRDVWVTPDGVRATHDALQAISEAELIVLGPGSLFTSLLPALLVPGIREAIDASDALVLFACNVATQPGETAGLDLADHLEALGRHGAGHLIDAVLANNRFDARPPAAWVAEPVRLRWPPAGDQVPRLVLDDVVDPANAHHHDPDRLAAAVLSVLQREGGRRRRPGRARTAERAS